MHENYHEDIDSANGRSGTHGFDLQSVDQSVRRLRCDSNYRRRVGLHRHLQSSRLRRLLDQHEIVRPLWDGTARETHCLPAREIDRWLAIVLAHCGCEPEEVAQAIWTRVGALAPRRSHVEDYVVGVVTAAFVFIASSQPQAAQ
jgi:hypothetical protein